MTNSFILALDQGTTGSTALALSQDFKVLGKHNVEFQQYFPRPGWVEHKAEDIKNSIQKAVEGCLEKAQLGKKNIAAIGITNQRETTCLFDQDGNPLHNFIVWQCRRSADICAALKRSGLESKVRQKTGLVLDPYFSATKLSWLFQNRPEFLAKAKDKSALFGTIDTYLLHWLTAGTCHMTDTTNASRTMLMNLRTGDWDEELLNIFGVPKACLPRIKSNSETYGHTSGLPFLPDGIPICSMVGDQQGALFGQGCFDAGMVKATYGTGSFILMNTGSTLFISESGLVSSVAIKLGEDTQYCLEGAAFTAGAAVQWLRDGLGIIRSAAEIEALATSIPSSEGVMFVPALTGLGSPYWEPNARGVISGITRGTTKAHIARATLEGIALQNEAIIRAMEKESGDLKELRVDGGGSQNNFLMQLQADLTQTICVRPPNLDTTAIGAALLAGLGCGFWDSKEALKQAFVHNRTYTPNPEMPERDALLSKWDKGVKLSMTYE